MQLGPRLIASAGRQTLPNSGSRCIGQLTESVCAWMNGAYEVAVAQLGAASPGGSTTVRYHFQHKVDQARTSVLRTAGSHHDLCCQVQRPMAQQGKRAFRELPVHEIHDKRSVHLALFVSGWIQDRLRPQRSGLRASVTRAAPPGLTFESRGWTQPRWGASVDEWLEAAAANVCISCQVFFPKSGHLAPFSVGNAFCGCARV